MMTFFGIAPRPTREITVQGRTVFVGGWSTPNAGLVLAGRMPIPLDIAKLAAGPDAWMRQIPVECRNPECRCEFRLADSDSHEYCQKCFDAAGEENARIDAA